MTFQHVPVYMYIRDGQLIVKIEIMSMFFIAIIISSSFFCLSIIENCNNRIYNR